ncbi:hypothetical protein [uncultured Roseobacter sp.]|uniref:hypothetical protein n=1 Tax=uncultured Roseobacter sp. TaxID=114847 RepID=UPI00262463CE|nr:hypothetical protein [uncultured Roseobacter sp.]
MSVEWVADPGLAAFHPRLEPVSAWLFRRNSPYLRTGGAATATLFSMPLDQDGFRPDVRDAWRALSVTNPASGDNPAQLAFGSDALDDLLDPLADDFEDPRVFVLPLASGAPLPAEELRRRTGIGSPRSRTPASPLPAPSAIIGTIDHGINIFHARFRHREDSSRVVAAWIQGADRLEDRLPFGREWLQADIENALNDTGGDEDQLLRLLGDDPARPGFSPLGFRTSHGTHVLDIAAGFDPDDAAGDTLPVIAVSLPPEVTRETAGSMLALPFALGLEYIADRARRLMARTGVVVPVIVNFSLGLTGGPRGGLHRLEQTIDRVAGRHSAQIAQEMGVAEAPFTVVVAAGNNNLSDGHARSLEAAQVLTMGWHLQPVDTSANFLEIRLAPEADPMFEPLSVTLSLTPPGAEEPISTTVLPTAGRTLQNIRLLQRNGAVIGRLSVWRHPEGIAVLTLALDATDPGRDMRPVSPPGTWGVTVNCNTTTPYRIDAWVLRDDVPGGFADTGRQSYLTDTAHRRRDHTGRLIVEDAPDSATVIRRAGTLNAAATATDQTRRYSVGSRAGLGADAPPAEYSATALDSTSERIDADAPGDRSPVRGGIPAAGSRSGSRVLISGTSVAAPQLVRHLASGVGTLSDAPDEDAGRRRGSQQLTGALAGLDVGE